MTCGWVTSDGFSEYRDLPSVSNKALATAHEYPVSPPTPTSTRGKKKKKNAPTEGQDTYILGIHVGYPKKLLQYGSVNYVLEK